MPRIPFPHILTKPRFANNFSLRFVQVLPIEVNGILAEHDHVQENLKSREFEPVYNCYLIKEIFEQRPAQGDWSAYEERPTYYKCRGEYIGQRFESTLRENKENYWQSSLNL